MALKANLREFPDLSRDAFQHPLDVQAAGALKAVPGLPRLIRFLSETFDEKFMTYQNLSSHLRVNANQYPSLYNQYVKLAQILDVRKLPSLFISTAPWTINAYAMGIENYSIVICSGLLDILEEDELLAILGHELGHVKCDHLLFKTLAYWVTMGGDTILSQAKIPGLDLLLSAGRIGLEYAIMDWNRKAELSCDRAALLATQDADVVARGLAKLGGFARRYSAELNVEEVENQCGSFDDLGNDSILVKLMKVQAMRTQTHPYPVVRVREIRNWARSTQYQQIVAGNYRKNAPDAKGGWAGVIVETPRAKECPKCKRPCGEDYTFCPSCQTNVRSAPFVCAKCRHHVEADWSACITCGAWLSDEPPRSSGRTESLPGT